MKASPWSFYAQAPFIQVQYSQDVGYESSVQDRRLQCSIHLGFCLSFSLQNCQSVSVFNLFLAEVSFGKVSLCHVEQKSPSQLTCICLSSN